MDEMKATVFLTVEMVKVMKIHKMRNSELPNLDFILEYLYTAAGENIDEAQYPKHLAEDIYGNLKLLESEGKELW